MTYTLKLFASLREHVGSDVCTLDSNTPLTVEQLLHAFYAKYPQVDQLRHVTRLAVNGEFANVNIELSPSAELALIPPVSGG